MSGVPLRCCAQNSVTTDFATPHNECLSVTPRTPQKKRSIRSKARLQAMSTICIGCFYGVIRNGQSSLEAVALGTTANVDARACRSKQHEIPRIQYVCVCQLMSVLPSGCALRRRRRVNNPRGAHYWPLPRWASLHEELDLVPVWLGVLRLVSVCLRSRRTGS